MALGDGVVDARPGEVEQGADNEAAPTLIAYRVSAAPRVRIVAAPRARDWMEATSDRFANRCLPLLLANQAGWFLLTSHAFTATWDGGAAKEALRFDYRVGEPPYPAISHFGHGILTWHVPYLFRTPPGYNLLARGPANHQKEGAFALEGLVEADWSVATFTMNWKVTTVGHPVTFEVGEPFCMVVPQRRGELEAFEPRVVEVAEEPELARAHQAWSASRARFLTDLKEPESEAVKRAWQKDYFRGTAPDGSTAPMHQTRLRVREFEEAEGARG